MDYKHGNNWMRVMIESQSFITHAVVCVKNCVHCGSHSGSVLIRVKDWNHATELTMSEQEL